MDITNVFQEAVAVFRRRGQRCLAARLERGRCEGLLAAAERCLVVGGRPRCKLSRHRPPPASGRRVRYQPLGVAKLTRRGFLVAQRSEGHGNSCTAYRSQAAVRCCGSRARGRRRPVLGCAAAAAAGRLDVHVDGRSQRRRISSRRRAGCASVVAVAVVVVADDATAPRRRRCYGRDARCRLGRRRRRRGHAGGLVRRLALEHQATLERMGAVGARCEGRAARGRPAGIGAWDEMRGQPRSARGARPHAPSSGTGEANGGELVGAGAAARRTRPFACDCARPRSAPVSAGRPWHGARAWCVRT